MFSRKSKAKQAIEEDEDILHSDHLSKRLVESIAIQQLYAAQDFKQLLQITLEQLSKVFDEWTNDTFTTMVDEIQSILNELQTKEPKLHCNNGQNEFIIKLLIPAHAACGKFVRKVNRQHEMFKIAMDKLNPSLSHFAMKALPNIVITAPSSENLTVNKEDSSANISKENTSNTIIGAMKVSDVLQIPSVSSETPPPTTTTSVSAFNRVAVETDEVYKESESGNGEAKQIQSDLNKERMMNEIIAAANSKWIPESEPEPGPSSKQVDIISSKPTIAEDSSCVLLDDSDYDNNGITKSDIPSTSTEINKKPMETISKDSQSNIKLEKSWNLELCPKISNESLTEDKEFSTIITSTSLFTKLEHVKSESGLEESVHNIETNSATTSHQLLSTVKCLINDLDMKIKQSIQNLRKMETLLYSFSTEFKEIKSNPNQIKEFKDFVATLHKTGSLFLEYSSVYYDALDFSLQQELNIELKYILDLGYACCKKFNEIYLQMNHGEIQLGELIGEYYGKDDLTIYEYPSNVGIHSFSDIFKQVTSNSNTLPTNLNKP